MKHFFCTLTLILSSWTITANNATTTYSKGTFHTSKEAIAQADYNTCSRVIDDFISQLQTNPEELFTWAFKNLGQTHQDDGADDVVMTINHVDFDSTSAKSVINVDLQMSNGLTLRNRDLMSYVHDNKDSTERTITVEFYYSGSLLKKADGIFHLQALDCHRTQLNLDIKIRFGWFFNLFITQRRYRNVMEWRIDKFIDNLREEAEKNK